MITVCRMYYIKGVLRSLRENDLRKKNSTTFPLSHDGKNAVNIELTGIQPTAAKNISDSTKFSCRIKSVDSNLAIFHANFEISLIYLIILSIKLHCVLNFKGRNHTEWLRGNHISGAVEEADFRAPFLNISLLKLTENQLYDNVSWPIVSTYKW